MFILQLFSNDSGEWLELNELGAVISRQPIADLAACPKINPHDIFTLIFPGEQLLLTTVKLPKMRASEQLKAIPYALEEQLASDPENMYIATGETKVDGSLVVAALDKNIMNTKVESWHHANLFPQRVLPDFLAVAWEPETWSVLIKKNMALVRTNFNAGFTADENNLFVFLQLALEKNKDHQPKKIVCWQQENILNPTEFAKLAIPVEFVDEAKHSPFDMTSLSSHPPINLLQGKYRPTSQSSSLKTNWIRCGIVASACMLILFFSRCIEWFYFYHQSNQLSNRIAVIYRDLFPGAADVLEPRFRTAELLKKYAGVSDGSVFLKLLGDAAKTLLQFPGTMVQSFQFSNKELKLQVQTNKMETITAYMQRLQSTGLLVDQRIVKSAPNEVLVEITLRNVHEITPATGIFKTER